MVGEHRDPVEAGCDKLAATLHRLGVRTMELGALARQQVLVDRRPGKRVPEAVTPAGGVDHEQLMHDRFAQRAVELGVGEPGDQPEQLIGHPPTAARGDAQHVLGRCGEALGAGQQDVAQ